VSRRATTPLRAETAQLYTLFNARSVNDLYIVILE